MKNRIAGGDTTCAANQTLRLQSVDLLRKIEDNPYYLTEGGDELAPRTFVDKIDVPTYHRRRVPGRADRRALVVDARRTSRRRPAAGLPHQRRAHREPGPAGPGAADGVHRLLRRQAHPARRPARASRRAHRSCSDIFGGIAHAAAAGPVHRRTRPTPRRWPRTRRSPRSGWSGRTEPVGPRARHSARPRATSRPGRCPAPSPRPTTCSPTALLGAGADHHRRRRATRRVELRLRPVVEAGHDLRRRHRTTSGRPRPRPVTASTGTRWPRATRRAT